MKIFFAIAISLAIHFGILYFLQDSKILKEPITDKKPDGKLSTSIQYVKIQKQTPSKQKFKNIIENKPKIIELPKEVIKKQEPKKTTPKIIQKKIQKQQEKPNNIAIKKEIQKIQEPIKKIEPPKEIIKNEPIEKKLLEDSDSLTKEYVNLYENFNQLPTQTKVFIIKNIKDIGQITQRYLIYPMMSAQAGQEGVNVVEFILFPDGKISTPKIIKSSTYFLLDDNTAETIQEAYHDYPRPQKPTPIRIFVKYHLIR